MTLPPVDPSFAVSLLSQGVVEGLSSPGEGGHAREHSTDDSPSMKPVEISFLYLSYFIGTGWRWRGLKVTPPTPAEAMRDVDSKGTDRSERHSAALHSCTLAKRGAITRRLFPTAPRS